MTGTALETESMFPTATGTDSAWVTGRREEDDVDMGYSRNTSGMRRAGVLLFRLTPAFLFSSYCLADEPAEPPWYSGRLLLTAAPEFSTGDYGAGENTDVWYLPVSARYEFRELTLTEYAHDRFSIRLTVPIVSIEGPGTVVAGTGGPVVVRGKGRGGSSAPTTSVTRTNETGLGDVQISASYHVLSPPGSKLPWLTVSGKVKTPTASESKNLGTGEADYAVFSELYQPIGRLGLFAGAGYRFMGDPDGLDLGDRWLVSAGIDAELSDTVSVGLSYDYRESSVSSVSDAHEVSPWFSIRLADRFRLEPFALVGLSGGSPDYGVGMRLSLSLRVAPQDGISAHRRLPPRVEQGD